MCQMIFAMPKVTFIARTYDQPVCWPPRIMTTTTTNSKIISGINLSDDIAIVGEENAKKSSARVVTDKGEFDCRSFYNPTKVCIVLL